MEVSEFTYSLQQLCAAEITQENDYQKCWLAAAAFTIDRRDLIFIRLDVLRVLQPDQNQMEENTIYDRFDTIRQSKSVRITEIPGQKLDPSQNTTAAPLLKIYCRIAKEGRDMASANRNKSKGGLTFWDFPRQYNAVPTPISKNCRSAKWSQLTWSISQRTKLKSPKQESNNRP